MWEHSLTHTRFGRNLLLGVCTLAACGEHSPSLPSGAAESGLPSDTARSVTLITGDRVTVTTTEHGGTVITHAAPGREHIGFITRQDSDDVIVIPRDVGELVGGGQLDLDLFNVSYLLANGYDDASQPDIPLLITGGAASSQLRGSPGVAAELRSRIASPDTAVTHVLPALGVVAARQHKTASTSSVLAELARSPDRVVWLDRRYQLMLDHSVPQTGAPTAWASGFTGAGVVVAVLDSGIDATHPDLAGVVVDAQNFADDALTANDTVGHGTHVASTIAGSGAASGGRLRGVAPDAQLLNGRVCDRFCLTSAVLAGIEWAAITKRAPIINMSFGGPDSPGIDPVEAAIDQLSAEYGTLFVVAAGNSGVLSVSSPSTADAALSVGSVDRAGELATTSSRGPRPGDGAVKPEITAPGVQIVAALAAGVEPIGTPINAFYTRLSGTSMATPHVAGAAAILRQQHPQWTGEQLKSALVGTANPHPELGVTEQGAGQLDVARASRQTFTAEPAAVNFGLAAFPHDDDPPLTRKVAYRNAGTEPVTLSIQGSLTGAGAAAPGMVTLSASSLTIPAGGDAELIITVDTRGERADVVYSGTVIASAGEQRIITPISVEREREFFDLTVTTLDRDGEPAGGIGFVTSVEPAGTRGSVGLLIRANRTVRIPANTYSVSLVAGGGQTSLVLVYPRFALSETTTLVLDGRQAELISVGVSGVPLEVMDSELTVWDSVIGESFSASGPGPIATGHFGPEAAPGELFSALAVAGLPVGSTDGAEIYLLSRRENDRVITGWNETIASSQLARVRTTHSGDDEIAYLKHIVPVPDGVPTGGLSFAFAEAIYRGPFKRTEYYYGDRIRWASVLETLLDFEGDLVTAAVVQGPLLPRRERDVLERWNRAPFGPAFTNATRANRTGDLLSVSPHLFSEVSSPSRIGTSVGTFRVSLFRNGALVDEIAGESSGNFTLPPVQVPPERAIYRLEAESTRHELVPVELSREVRATWTFSSRHAPGTVPEVLPLPVLRFAPELDLHNHAPRRFPLALPVLIGRPPGAARPTITNVAVEASFDDGATWRPVIGVRTDDRWRGLVIHPPGATFVSLRGSARDADGTRVEQTIIRAYKLAP